MVTYFETFSLPYDSCVADKLPYQQFAVTLAAEVDIRPLKLGYCIKTTATFDLCPTRHCSADTEAGDIYVFDIPADYPARTSFDQSTAYAASAELVPVVRCQLGRYYHICTATDYTSYSEGQILVPAANGDLAIPTDPTPGAIELSTHCFRLIHAISTTQIVVQYMGFYSYDDT